MKCMYQAECFEQRGRCTSFVTPKQYRKRLREQIESVNKGKKSSGAATSANEAGMEKAGD